MPIIQVDMISGRTKEQKAGLIRDITDAVVKHTGAKAESVHVLIREAAAENFGANGQPKG